MTTQLPELQENRAAGWLASLLVGLLLVTLLIAVGMAVAGRPSDELLVLAGVMVTQAVVLVGVLLRDSADRRTFTLAAADSARTATREKEAENRLLMETTLRGVELISVDESATRNSAALLALDTLGQKTLAVALLNSLWPHEQVGPEAATLLISSAFSSGDERLQKTAAAILSNNAASTYPLIGTIHYMPDEVQDWDLDLPETVRLSFTSYLFHVTRHLTVDSEIEVGPITFVRLSHVISSLRAAAVKDTSQDVHSNALILLNSVLPMRTLSPTSATMDGHDGSFSFDELAAWVDQELGSGPFNVWFVDQAEEIDQWWAERQASGP